MQRDDAVRIPVFGGQHERIDTNVDVELLSKLARESVDVGFTFRDLAPGKFPEPFEVGALEAACEEERAVLFDDGGDDDNHDRSVVFIVAYERQLLAIGHAAHFGFRATQTVAPKSINP